MRIVITGAGGFVGNNISRVLHPAQDIIGISEGGRPGKGMIISDITNPRISSRIRGDIDCIVHLAALSDVQACHDRPRACFDTNVGGTANVMELARKKDSSVIFASTSHVYDTHRDRLSERSPTIPHTIYGASKLAAETVCGGFAREYGMDVTILRLFSVYGRRLDGRGVISKIISQLDNDTIRIGNLDPRRDFIHVDDVVSAFEFAIKSASGFNTYNVGTARTASIRDVCNIIEKIRGRPLKIRQADRQMRNIDAGRMCADITKIKKAGWSPRISLHAGLQKTITEIAAA